MRICKWRDGIVCAFDQPLPNWHGVVCARLRALDMELRRFQREHYRELLGQPYPTYVRNGVTANCGMQLGGPVTFCETFDNKKSGIPSRTGDLDPNVWGVSRATGNNNFGQGLYNGWAATTQLQTCNGVTTVTSPNDIMICNGQLREATNDNPTGVHEAGMVTTLAMYPKQPFDFAGRRGTASFDVSNDSHGTHAAWPEFWITNLPVPAPFNHFDTWQALPQHGFGIRFAASAAAGAYGACPNGKNLDKRRWTVASAVVVRNYVLDDTEVLAEVEPNWQLSYSIVSLHRRTIQE